MQFNSAKTEAAGTKEIKNVVDWIGRFNAEVGPGIPKLSAHIRGTNNFSVLHAAITFARPDLVMGLLPLLPQSAIGPALILARRMANDAQEKADCASFQAKSATNDDGEFDAELTNQKEFWQEMLNDRAENLKKISREILTQASNRPLTNVATSTAHCQRQVSRHQECSVDALESKSVMKGPANQNRDSIGGSELHLFLKCVVPKSSEDDGWTSMHLVSKQFFEEHGSEDHILFRSARAQATSKGFVEWGKADEDSWGEWEVVSPDEFDEEAAEASLRTTAAGAARLSQPFEADPSQSSRAFVSGHQEHAVNVSHKDTSMLHLFLKCVVPRSSEGDGWISMHLVSKQFFEEHGSEDSVLFRSARAQATSKGYVEWGKADADSWGEWEVVSPGEFDAEAAEASLRITEAGRTFLSDTSTERTEAPAIVARRTTVSARVASPNVQNLQPITATVATTAPHKKCKSMPSFLQTVARSRVHDEANGWVKMGDLVTSFDREFTRQNVAGPSDIAQGADSLTADFRRWCEEATQKKFVIWGRSDPSRYESFEVCAYQQISEHASDAVLKLTEEGHNLAFGSGTNDSTTRAPNNWWRSNVEAGLQQKFERNSSDSQASIHESGVRGEPNVSAAAPALAGAASLAPQGRGRGRTLPAWMTRQQQSHPQQSEGVSVVTNGSSSPHGRQQQANEESTEAKGNSAVRETNGNDLDGAGVMRAEDRPVSRLDKYWFLPQTGLGREACRNFQSASRVVCKFKSRCNYAHVQPPLGEDVLQSYSGPIEALSRQHFTFELGGGELITAAYRDPKTNIYYVAEGGRVTQRDETSGVHWYASNADAMRAVEVVYAASQHPKKRPSPYHGKEADRPPKRRRR